MMTQKGRVVYDRKKDPFTPKALVRILNTYTVGATGAAYGTFIIGLLEKIMSKHSANRTFVINFWRFLLNSFNRAALEDLFTPGDPLREVDLSVKIPGGPKSKREEKVTESPLERKRRLIEELN